MPRFENGRPIQQGEWAPRSEPTQSYRMVPVDAKVAFAFHLMNLTGGFNSDVDKITPATMLREPIDEKAKVETERHADFLKRSLAHSKDGKVDADYIRWLADTRLVDGRITQPQYLQLIDEARQYKDGGSYRPLEEHPLYSIYEREYGASRFNSEE